MTFHDSPWPEGAPCWVDLTVPDLGRAKDFYRGLLGWEYLDSEEEFSNYVACTLDGRVVAGIGSPPPEQQVPTMWLPYVSVTDAAATCERIVAAGGKIEYPATEVGSPSIGTMGSVAVAFDPNGALFGLWQADKHVGVRVASTAGSVNWVEIMTTDFDRARSFYGSVFGYQYDDMSQDGFYYATVLVENKLVGGLGELSARAKVVHPHWVTYFGTEDVDASTVRVAELGGTVIDEAFDTPHGRLAVVTDDQGARFRLITPNRPTSTGHLQTAAAGTSG